MRRDLAKIQVINLLIHKQKGVMFRSYLKSIGATVLKITNRYEAARFKVQGKTCVIYYKKSKGVFSFSDEFARAVYDEWRAGKKMERKGKEVKKGIAFAKQEIRKLMAGLNKQWEFVRFMNKDWDGYFSVEGLRTIEDARLAYKGIKQYRRLFKVVDF